MVSPIVAGAPPMAEGAWAHLERVKGFEPSAGEAVNPRPKAPLAPDPDTVLRVATYNIHKGVRGVGPRKRLEIHNLAVGVEGFDADLVFLQEVRRLNRAAAKRFPDQDKGWPCVPQADYLAPKGFEVAYRTNAITPHGEHGNALLSRWPLGSIGHQDVSDHRFEQRGLLYATVHWNGEILHAIVVHLGLRHASRIRQVARLARFIQLTLPPKARLIVAGDFNDWGRRLDAPMGALGLQRALGPKEPAPRMATFPSRLPVFSMDPIYIRGLRCLSASVPRGVDWARMSDHLPLVAELVLA